MKQMDFRPERLSFVWRSRLPRGDIEHPASIRQFDEWAEIDESAITHRAYLKLCDSRVQEGWITAWDQLYAVGPFLGRRRPYRSIPFVLVVNYRRPYRHLIQLSELLADAYLEFGILPDLHLLKPQLVRELEGVENLQWLATKRYSIEWKQG